MSKICRHCLVSGTVQGVYYRQTTKEQALSWNLTGWVRNLRDGRVEVLICGEEEQVEELLKWLPMGPPSAKVTNVEVSECAYEQHPSFEIIR